MPRSMFVPKGLKRVPAPGKPLKENDFETFVLRMSQEIARLLDLKKRYAR